MSAVRTPVTGVKGFKADLRDVRERYSKRTSAQHKRSILLLVIGGALLRAYMLWQPITYNEARAFDLFSSKSYTTIFSEHTDPLNHVLFSAAAKLSTDLFGISTIALRLPAFLASVLALPLFYLFVRAMFNRYIGMLALALVAASAPLIEYSALGHGHAFTWLFLIAALALGRHFTKENNVASAGLIGVVLALGMWSTTEFLYAAAGVFVWLFIYILDRFQGSITRRLSSLAIAFLVFITSMVLFHLPIIAEQGIGILWEHPTLPMRNWKLFKQDHHDGVFDLWVAIVDTTGGVVASLAIIAVLVAAYISSKYRTLMLSMAIAAIVLVLAKARVAQPDVWYYMLFFFHIGTAISLFYLLKFIQEKFMKSLGKRTRTAYTSFGVFVAFGTGLISISDRIPRFPEAAWAGAYLGEVMEPRDRVFTEQHWDHPVRFHAYANGVQREQFHTSPDREGWVYLVIPPAQGVGPAELLLKYGSIDMHFGVPEKVKDWPRLEIFAAPKRAGSFGKVPEGGPIN